MTLYDLFLKICSILLYTKILFSGGSKKVNFLPSFLKKGEKFKSQVKYFTFSNPDIYEINLSGKWVNFVQYTFDFLWNSLLLIAFSEFWTNRSQIFICLSWMYALWSCKLLFLKLRIFSSALNNLFLGHWKSVEKLKIQKNKLVGPQGIHSWRTNKN